MALGVKRGRFMAQSFGELGVYLVGMSVLLVGAGMLVLWGLFGDRCRGRSRCPKCWYDMRGRRAGREGLICPECGHDAGYEKRLLKNHRRWLAVVVGLVVALPNAYMLSTAAGWYRERRAIARIDSRLEDYAKYRGTGASCYPFWPLWFRERLPGRLGELSDRARIVALDWGTVTDKDLEDCAKLRHIEELYLCGAQITDAGMRYIGSLPDVKTLDLEFTPIGDAGLAEIRGMRSLETLLLRKTNVTNDGLKHLHDLDRLSLLRLWATRVDGSGLVHLHGMKSLRWLFLTPSDAGGDEAAVNALKEALPGIEIRVD
jgi:hypothetical protein